MPNKKRELTADEVARRGDEIYARLVRDKVEHQHHGRIVAIDVYSEEYEVGDTASAAAHELLTRVRDAEIWLVRVGYRALHHIGHSASPGIR